jgi:hypothetical protein
LESASRQHGLTKARPSRIDRADLLSIKEPVFRSVDDSVRSIVPSRLSHFENDASSVCSSEGEELWYIPFAFENQLFTSNVYKRNFRVPQIRNLHQNVKIDSSFHDSLATPVIINDAASRGILQGECTVDDGLAQDPDVRPDLRDSRKEDKLESMSDHMLVSTISPESLPCLDHVQPKDNTVERASLMSSDSRDEEGSEIMSEHMLVSAVPPGSLLRFENVRPKDNPIACPSPVSPDSSPVELLKINNPAPKEIRIQGSSSMPISIKRKPVASAHNVLPTSQSTHLTAFQKGIGRRRNPKTSCQHELLVKIDHLESFLDLFITLQEKENVIALKAIQHLGFQKLIAPSACAHCIFTNSDVAIMLQQIAEQENSLFSTIMQTAAFTYGSQVLRELVESFTASEHQTPRITYMSTQQSAITLTHWTSKILDDPEVHWAAAHRDEVVDTGILGGHPSALQLACLTKRVGVVEYLLANGIPTLSLNWTADPFILATKRRCKPILELFFKRVNATITDNIKNLALIMVANQDCILSERWMETNQNENKRCGEDVNIVSLLLTHGASPNACDKHGMSVLSMAIRSAYNSNRWSLQIVDILLRKGATLGIQERIDMQTGPQGFLPIIQRHKLGGVHPVGNTGLPSEVRKTTNHELVRIWENSHEHIFESSFNVV